MHSSVTADFFDSFIFSHFLPDIQDHLISLRRHSFERNVAGGEDVATAFLAVGEAVFSTGLNLLIGAGLQGCTVYIAAESYPVTV